MTTVPKNTAAFSIPTAKRTQVGRRDRLTCVRCSMKGNEWHHRRSRRVNDDHTHCACVGIMLCGTCHRWVHANPRDAEALGLIVSTFQRAPFTVPQRRRTGWFLASCDGALQPLSDDQVQFGTGGPPLLLRPAGGRTARLGWDGI